MLLSVLAFVLHGAVPLMPPSFASGKTLHVHAVHVDHSGHAATSPDASLQHGDQGRSHAVGDVGQLSMPSQLDCCAAVAAVVLPADGAALAPRTVVMLDVAPKPSSILDGLIPEGPSKPPRTSYQG